MTDNAWGYARNRSLRELLATREIKHIRTQPYRPQTNGKVERFNRTLLEEWAYVRPYGSNEMARRDVELGLGLCASAVTRASPWWSTALSTPRVADQRGVPASLA
jgi:transposase InsO family protein